MHGPGFQAKQGFFLVSLVLYNASFNQPRLAISSERTPYVEWLQNWTGPSTASTGSLSLMLHGSFSIKQLNAGPPDSFPTAF